MFFGRSDAFVELSSAITGAAITVSMQTDAIKAKAMNFATAIKKNTKHKFYVAA